MELLDKTRGPLPGSAANNRRFVINYMSNHGFEVMEDPMSEYPQKRNYYLRGEHVAWSYENIIYLHKVLPSLLEMGILAQRRTTEIPFDLPGIEVHNRLQDSVKELKNSLGSYDELVKKSRVQKVREYFDRKRDEAERFERALEKLPGWREYEANKS